MDFHFEKINQNEINELIANINCNYVFKDLNTNTTAFYKIPKEIARGLKPVKRKYREKRRYQRW